MAKKPEMHNSESNKELAQAEKQFDEFEKQLNDLSLDRMNAAPKQEQESQTKIASSDVAKLPDHYLKPAKIISSREKFNEKFREKYDFDKQYVYFTAENKEVMGEAIEMWTKPYPGLPAEFWRVPVNKPVWGPRYLAEQIKKCHYHRFTMDMKVTQGSDFVGQYHGSIIIDTTIPRLDAVPASTRKSIFMGAASF